MKNKIIIALFALIISFCSCSKDDMPFEGKDNYISLFQLKVDGLVYKALITDNKVDIEMTENIDLTNATVKYSISELSTITPDPKTITNWENPIEFIVSSYNKDEEKTYHFSIIKKEMVNDGDIELLSQADADAFASTGATKIDGNLIIGDVKNLEVLNKITEVSKTIIIKDSCHLENFNVLTHLKKAGNIYFGTKNTPFAPSQEFNISFESLVDVGEICINTAKVKTIAFPDLKNAYNININSNTVDSLNFSSLDKVYGDICIQSKNNEKLTSINFNKLQSVLGSITFNKLYTTKQIDLSQLETIGGSLSVLKLKVVTNMNLSKLTSVDNTLEFINLDKLKSLNIPKLAQVGSFKIKGGWGTEVIEDIKLPELIKVNKVISISHVLSQTLSFPKLATIGEKLEIGYATSITSIDISNLTACKTIDISGIKKVTNLNLSAIANLETVEIVSAHILEDFILPQTIKTLTLNGGSLATNFPKIKGLETISGKFKITNYKLPKISVSSVKEIGTFLQNSASGQTDLEFPNLENIEKLELSLTDLISFRAPNLKKIDKLDLSNMWALKNIELPLLTEITTELKIKGAGWAGAANRCLILDLNAFELLSTVGTVDISNCGNLIDFSGLKNAIPSITKENWKVENCKYSPTYQNMLDGEYVENKI